MQPVKTSKGLIIIFAAAVVLFGGAYTYSSYMMPSDYDLEVHDLTTFSKPAKDTTADWETYENKEYGFSFKYPQDWELKTYTSENTVSVSKGSDHFSINYYNSVVDESENKSNKYGATSIEELVVKNPTITKEELIEFKGKKAYEVVWGGLSETFSTLVDNDGKLIVLGFLNKSNKSDLTKIDNQIMTSLKFSTPIITTATTKTYSSTDCKYSINYPAEWTSNSVEAKTVILRSAATKAAIDKIAAENGATEGPAPDMAITCYDSLAEADGNSPKKYSNVSDLVNDANYYQAPAATTFAGQNAYEAISNLMYTQYTIVFDKEGRIYKLDFNVEKKADLTDDLKSIMESFKLS